MCFYRSSTLFYVNDLLYILLMIYMFYVLAAIGYLRYLFNGS